MSPQGVNFLMKVECNLEATDRLSETTETYVRLLAAYRGVRPFASSTVLAALASALSFSLTELEDAKREVGQMIDIQVDPDPK